MNMLYKKLLSIITLVVSITNTNGYSTLLRGGSSTSKNTSHPALSSMAGSWDATNGISTSILGPFTHANDKWLTITKADNDGNIYLKHDIEDQLMRVQNEQMQYCFAYDRGPQGAKTAPFQLMPPGYDGNDASTTVDFCWRGPRLPTHKADCTGCECAHWQLKLGTDGKTMKSIFWMSYPVIHMEVELTKTDTIVSTEEVVDGWQCKFANRTGTPKSKDLIHHGNDCPYLKFQSKKVAESSSSSLSDKPAKNFCLSVSSRDIVHDAQLEYAVPHVPCMPCNVSFTFSVLTDEDDYVALGFRGSVYSYSDWNDQTAKANRTDGGYPDYLGMATSPNWESIYGPQPINGRIALGYVNKGKGYLREMEATHYVGPPSDIQDEEPLFKDTSVEYADGRTVIHFTAEMFAGQTGEDIDWNPSAPFSTTMARLRIMWATGSIHGDGIAASVGFHDSARAISPIGFPAYNEPRQCERDDTNTKSYLSVA